jgi:hypothetical protein
MIVFLAVTIPKSSVFRSEVLFLARFDYLLALARGQRISTEPSGYNVPNKMADVKALDEYYNLCTKKQKCDSYSNPHF